MSDGHPVRGARRRRGAQASENLNGTRVKKATPAGTFANGRDRSHARGINVDEIDALDALSQRALGEWGRQVPRGVRLRH